MQQSTPAISFTPSFTTTTTHSSSSATLADIAARVVHEFRLEQPDGFDDDDLFGDVADYHHPQNPTIQEKEEDDDNSSGDFEFPSVCRDPPQSISADEIFHNGQIRPVFPVFGRTDLLFGGGGGKAMNCSSKRASLRTLMREDSRDAPSCSSSESDDLDGVPAEIYCAWTPKPAAAAEVKKSGSTGSLSKRWRIRNLLFRSNSDGRGRDSFVATEKGEEDYGKRGVAAKDGERRRLYGRQNWVGLFGNVNGGWAVNSTRFDGSIQPS